ncbi:MAG: outer membrane lipoprotein carrier protein LolA [Bacteroidales bacterium]|nr:outer membrane lipoprotein carrier protein LolA [Bacteroidales bacterium]
MKTRLILFYLILISGTLYAQKDPVAKSILDKFSEKALTAPSVLLDFTLVITDDINKTTNESEGILVIKESMYKLDLPENIIWFNGTTTFTYAPEVEEVTITEPDPDAEEFLTSPELLFTLYRNDYKYRLVDESTNGFVIDLYPENLITEFSRIRLHIAKNYVLTAAEYKRKDGITIMISVNDYNLTKKYNESFFNFDPGKYKNAEIIDMRF